MNKPYQVISANVIRNALKLSNMPHAKIKLDGTYRWPDGSTSCDYRLTWDRSFVERCQGEKITHDGSAAYTRFRERLSGCFCSDITVVELFSQQPHGKIIARLYCKIRPH